MKKQGITAIQLMKIKAFSSKVTFLTPTISLNKKTITHVTIQEAPDLYEWVTGGELVLTTWFAFSREPELVENAIDKLFEKISAIGIKTQRFIEKIPDVVFRLAIKHDVPVFEIRKEVKFRELVTIVNSQIQNYQTNMLLEINDYYQRVMNLSFDRNTKTLILNELSEELGKSCFCLDYNYEIIAKKNIGNVSYNKLVELKDKIQKHMQRNVNTLQEFKIEDFNVYCCFAREKMIGFLLVQSTEDFDEKEKIIIRETTIFMAMHLWNAYYTNQQQSYRIWKGIISGAVFEKWEIEEKLNLLGIHCKQEFIISAFSKSNKYQNWFQYLNGHFHRKILLENEASVLMFCGLEEFNYPFSVLKKDFQEYSLTNLVVTTEPFTNVQMIRTYFFTLKHIFHLLRSLNMHGLFRTEDWLGAALILSAKESNEYSMVNLLILQPILEYDKEYNTNLFKTLETAISTNSLEMTAQKMFVHINTIRYRLQKIQDLTSKSFFKFNDRYLLYAAVLLSKTLNADIKK